eukprot:scaffold22559_cov111-Cylindrotheca_fusiformis.AAC.2
MKYFFTSKERGKSHQQRISRDEQRLKERAAFAASASTLAEDLVMELNGTRILVCVIFLFLAGASMTTSYLLTKHPECFGHSSKTNLKNQFLPGEIPMLRSGSALGSVESAKQKSKELEDINRSVQCTPDQMAKLQKQLDGSSCQDNPWSQQCSMTKATTKGCQDPIWVREFFASTTLSMRFKSLLVDYDPNDSLLADFPMDALYFGSHNSKYDINAWRRAAKAGAACKKSLDFVDEQSAQSVVVVKNTDAMKATMEIKKSMGLSDDEMLLEQLNTGSNTVVRKFIVENFPGKDPIHYLKVNGGYNFLASWFSAKGLSKAWYLEFTVNWTDEWTTGDLGLLLNSLLPKTGFMCYWAGTQGRLWRITGCWQEHYSFKTWANVACVNKQISEAKPLLEKMEAIFDETLASENR